MSGGPPNADQDGPETLVLNGRRYRLGEDIHTKTHTRVVRALDRALNRNVVIKLLNARDEHHALSFQKEVKALSMLQHPNNVELYDAGVEELDGQRWMFLVTEMIRGRDLREMLKSEGELSVERGVGIARQALSGLAEAHSIGILHGDIKPENLMVSRHLHQRDHVKLIDYGLARLRNHTDEIQLRDGKPIVYGTPRYMAPEVASGKKATIASDLYSLAVLLYECLAGRAPFEGKEGAFVMHQHMTETAPKLHLVANVPRALSSVIHKGLEKKPRDRFEDATAFFDALGLVDAVSGPSQTLERFPVLTPQSTPDFVTKHSAIRRSKPTPEKPCVWIFSEAPAVSAPIVEAVLEMMSLDVRVLSFEARRSMLQMLKRGEESPPEAIVFGDLHAIAEDPLLVHLRDLGTTERILLSTHLHPELLQNTINFCGVDRHLVAPFGHETLKKAIQSLVKRRQQQNANNQGTFASEELISEEEAPTSKQTQKLRRTSTRRMQKNT